MTRYLLNMWQPAGVRPPDDVLVEVMRKLTALTDEMKDAGQWVFNGGLHAPEASTVVRSDDLVTDGPYAEGKEFIGGFWIVDAPDLDAALEWARRSTEVTSLPVEVRPFAG
jgi:hypothetical protein